MNTTQTFDINAVTAQWRTVHKQRLELEGLAKKLKAGPEAELEAQILMYLDTQQLQGAKVQGGTIARKNTTRVEIADTEVVCRVMFQKMIEALQQGKPLADCLLLQKAAHKGIVTELVRAALGVDEDADVTDETFNTVATQLGMKAVSKTSVSFSAKQ